jgi:hypothetical protein
MLTMGIKEMGEESSLISPFVQVVLVVALGRDFAEEINGAKVLGPAEVATASLSLRDAASVPLDAKPKQILFLLGGTVGRDPLRAQRFCLAEEIRVFMDRKESADGTLDGVSPTLYIM